MKNFEPISLPPAFIVRDAAQGYSVKQHYEAIADKGYVPVDSETRIETEVPMESRQRVAVYLFFNADADKSVAYMMTHKGEYSSISIVDLTTGMPIVSYADVNKETRISLLATRSGGDGSFIPVGAKIRFQPQEGDSIIRVLEPLNDNDQIFQFDTNERATAVTDGAVRILKATAA